MTISIVIVDDHAILREGLGQVLAQQPDLEVVGSSGDGRQSLKLVAQLRPDVVILDISMPGLNGIEVARQLQESGAACAVVILSMHASPEYVFQAIEAGARGYLQKESAASDIVEAVRAVRAGRRYLGPGIAELVAEHLASRKTGDNPLQLLSRREREILQLVAEGHSSAEIGELLFLSPKTVDSYRSRLMGKLGLADVTALVKFAIRHGVIPLD
ncbi:MAG TPA: response regulator transcription factor [Ramlibacter sp.]|uniref:response regulator transcription factor n=1 Tax=Ramlibacter sp. TaxID=1917967 RepID=UPI002CEA6909|nr:response regulator transcription factor [Ramlibacter sp.]HVZ45623.1 response regulator transcription factor [Ramlibacter sp.]